MPVPKRLLSELARFDRAEGLLRPGDKVLAGVSGGADSVCLAHYLARTAGRRGLGLAVLHVHHGLRGRSADRDAAFVERLARDLGVPFRLEMADAKALAARERRSHEDAARRLRYAAFAKWAKRLSFNKVATAHQADDQAETVLLHLLRGKKAGGLAGIPPKRALEGAGGIEVVRPLLPVSRKDVRAYLKAYRLDFREDESNESEKHTRNWIRLKVLPLLEKRNPGLRANLLAISSDVRRLAGLQ